MDVLARMRTCGIVPVVVLENADDAMETAKANGLNPEKSIRHLLTILQERFAKDSKAAVDDLLPWPDGVMELCKA